MRMTTIQASSLLLASLQDFIDRWKGLLSKLNSPDDLVYWLQQYEALGPVFGLLLPFIESFLFFLPLVFIIIANANAFGTMQGFILSFVGIVLGNVTVFVITRKFSGRISQWIRRKYKRSRALLHWIEKRGFAPIFLYSCMPFAPSIAINVISGLSRIPVRIFAAAILLGKAFAVFIITWIGHDILSLLYNPWKLILTVSLLLLLYVLGRVIELRLKPQ